MDESRGRIVWNVAWATMVLLLFSGDVIAVKAADPDGRLTLSPATVDFGTLCAPAGLVIKEVTLSNHGDIPVRIDPLIKTSCGCTVVTAKDTEIGPHGEIKLRVSVDLTLADGEINKQYLITAHVGDADRAIVGTINGKVITPIEQTDLLMISGFRSTSELIGTGRVRLMKHVPNTRTIGENSIKSLQSIGECLAVSFKLESQDKEFNYYRVSVVYRSGHDKVGLWRKHIIPIQLELSDGRVIDDGIEVMMDVADLVRLDPTVLRVSMSQNSNAEIKGTVVLQAAHGSKISIVAISQASDKAISIREDSMGGESDRTLDVLINRKDILKRLQSSSAIESVAVKVKIDDETRDVIIPIELDQ
jgi:Protein of unknown function (DUF1573)